MKSSVESGQPVTLESVDTFCDGTAVTRPGDLTFEVCKEFIDEFITVTNDDVSAAMRQLWEAKRLIPEPSGAMGVAGMMQYTKENAAAMKDKKVLCIICGANMDFSKLSTIARKSSASGDVRRYYRIQMPEGKGSLLKILETHFQNFNVAEFLYGKISEDSAWQTIAIDAKTDEFGALEQSLSGCGHKFEDITQDPDIKYRLINYNPATFKSPLFMSVEFPERKGALRDFLRAISNNASICYFNYAYSGEVIGRALMGFEFENTENRQKFLTAIKGTVTKCTPIDSDTEKRILQH
jgi:threonine dehydratase